MFDFQVHHHHEADERVTRLLSMILTRLTAVETRLAGVEAMVDRTSKELRDDVDGIKSDMDSLTTSVASAVTTIRDQQTTIADLQVQIAALKAGQPVSQEALNDLVASTDAIKRSGDAIVQLLTPATPEPAATGAGVVEPPPVGDGG